MVGEVAGLGLLGRIQMTADRATRKPLPAHLLAGDRVAAEMRARRVIMRQLPYDVLSYSPPLCLTEVEADQIARAFADSIDAVHREIRDQI